MFICILKKFNMGRDVNIRFMNLKEIIIDAMRYSVSDPKLIILLGVVLLLADILDELSGAGEISIEMSIFLFSIVIFLAILEAGYVFRIVEETIQGSKKLPNFNKFGNLFFHGVKEIIVLIIYFSVPLVLFGLYFFSFFISMDLNDVPGESAIIFLGLASLTALIYVFFPAVILHRAHNNGNFRSSFDLRKIYLKIRNVGLKRLIVVYLGIFIIVTIIELALKDSISSTIPIFGELIPDLIIAPLLLIFTTRVLGLIDQP